MAILKRSFKFGRYMPRSILPIQPRDTPDFRANVVWDISFTRRKYLIWCPLMTASLQMTITIFSFLLQYLGRRKLFYPPGSELEKPQLFQLQLRLCIQLPNQSSDEF